MGSPPSAVLLYPPPPNPLTHRSANLHAVVPLHLLLQLAQVVRGSRVGVAWVVGARVLPAAAGPAGRDEWEGEGRGPTCSCGAAHATGLMRCRGSCLPDCGPAPEQAQQGTADGSSSRARQSVCTLPGKHPTEQAPPSPTHLPGGAQAHQHNGAPARPHPGQLLLGEEQQVQPRAVTGASPPGPPGVLGPPSQRPAVPLPPLWPPDMPQRCGGNW